MNHLPENLLAAFTAVHDRINELWATARTVADLEPLEAFCHETYHGTYGGPGLDKVQPFERKDGLEGVRQAIASGNTTRIENRTIRMRSVTEAVVFFERIFAKGDRDVARLFTVENWRLVDGAWKLMRETVEQVAE
ncbi:MAG TPA: hypothetical protein VK191_01245 [Symbiobacteriaceae bacterium]|nr:hypothetical protein [Symbiobacteriaceae bacterium]